MDIIDTENQYIMNTYSRQDIVIVKGENATCLDENDKSYVDFGSGIGVNSLGYCDKDWSDAVCHQAKTLQHASNLYYTEPMVKLAKTLCTLTDYCKMFFANSGAEANECAIKLARKYSSDKYGDHVARNKILSLKNSFHGRTITTLAATGQDVFHQHFFPFTGGFDFAEANNIDDVKQKLGSDNGFCAVMLEFIQGEGGVLPLEKSFVTELFDYCRSRDILIIADEVQTGIGRTGKLLASENYNVKPNITTLAKGLGGGLPIGAALADKTIANVFSKSDHGTTFGGNPVVCAGANVVLEKLSSDGFLKEVAAKGDYLRNKLSDVDEIEGIDGIGLMLGLRLKTKKAADVVSECIKKGCIPLTAKEKVRLLPPLTITYQELDKGIEILKSVLN